ncbi:pentapeptide repeat-containing protein [Fusibacter sp. JL298sf-3]
MNKKKVPIAPELPKTFTAKQEDEQVCYEDEAYVSERFYEGCDFTRCRARHVMWRSTRFLGCIFRDSSFEHVDANHVVFENCDFSNSDFSDSIFHMCAFINCKFVGANFSGGNFYNVTFDKAYASYVNFRFSKCDTVVFSDCKLEGAEFIEMRHKFLTLEASQLRGAQFSGCLLKGVDLSTCDIEAIGVGMQEIKGAVIDEGQAVELLRLMDVKIKF